MEIPGERVFLRRRDKKDLLAGQLFQFVLLLKLIKQLGVQ